jgi:predicted HTH domain antitoxin
MTIELPDVKIGSEPLTPEQARIEIACGLYAAWKVSEFQATQIAGLPRILFWEELGKRKIPRQYGPEDLEHDLRVLDELAAKKNAA